MKRNRLLFFLCIIVALLTLLLVLFSFISLGKEYTSIKAVEALHIEENNSSETNEDETEYELVEELNIDEINENTDDEITIEEDNEIVIITETPDIYELKSQEVLEKQKELESIEDNKEWFIAYKKLIEEYSEWVDPPESIYDYFSDDEIYLMQRCIETETFEQDFDSKVNVASVILNRLNSEEFSNDVHKVIVKGQFAFGRKKISEDTKLALEYAYMIGDTTEGALYFHSLAYKPRFNGADYIFTDEAGHHFYR